VLVHGYGGSGALFFPILKKLGAKFNVILIDIIGMGGSSRPADFKAETFSPQESIDYFVNYFEKWRVKMGPIMHQYYTRKLD